MVNGMRAITQGNAAQCIRSALPIRVLTAPGKQIFFSELCVLFIAKNGRAKCDLESLSLSLFFVIFYFISSRNG